MFNEFSNDILPSVHSTGTRRWDLPGGERRLLRLARWFVNFNKFTNADKAEQMRSCRYGMKLTTDGKYDFVNNAADDTGEALCRGKCQLEKAQDCLLLSPYFTLNWKQSNPFCTNYTQRRSVSMVPIRMIRWTKYHRGHQDNFCSWGEQISGAKKYARHEWTPETTMKIKLILPKIV